MLDPGQHAEADDSGALLTVDELADYLQVPAKTIYAWRHKNAGPPGFRVGRYLRFRASDVESWLAELAIAEQE